MSMFVRRLHPSCLAALTFALGLAAPSPASADAPTNRRAAGGKLDHALTWNGQDAWVIGDFHGEGMDPVKQTQDYVIDGIEDVFIHGGWGTATLGINPVQATFGNKNQLGLTWVQAQVLLRAP